MSADPKKCRECGSEVSSCGICDRTAPLGSMSQLSLTLGEAAWCIEVCSHCNPKAFDLACGALNTHLSTSASPNRLAELNKPEKCKRCGYHKPCKCCPKCGCPSVTIELVGNGGYVTCGSCGQRLRYVETPSTDRLAELRKKYGGNPEIPMVRATGGVYPEIGYTYTAVDDIIELLGMLDNQRQELKAAPEENKRPHSCITEKQAQQIGEVFGKEIQRLKDEIERLRDDLRHPEYDI